ncbi:hypothetical protein ANCDUO_12314, partial [Ancylostoma duodenale]
CYDDFMYKFVRRLGVTVFSIDYRLAPEYPFPYPVDDCEAVVNDLYHDSYTRFNIDRDKICIAGDSAGGNLAAVVTQRLLVHYFSLFFTIYAVPVQSLLKKSYYL